MTAWTVGPIIKVYEALGCIADDRIEIHDADDNGKETATVTSSDLSKTYKVIFEPGSPPSITTNDNASLFVGYLGYPAIAFLMKKALLTSTKEAALLACLKDIEWKKIATKIKNDWSRLEKIVQDDYVTTRKHLSVADFVKEIENYQQQLKDLGPLKLKGGAGGKAKPKAKAKAKPKASPKKAKQEGKDENPAPKKKGKK